MRRGTGAERSRALRIRPLAWWLPVGAAGVLALAVGTPLEAGLAGVPPVLALAGGALQAGSIVLASLVPRTAIGLHLAAIAIHSVAATATGVPWPLSVTGLIALCLFVIALAIRHPPVYALAAWGAALALLIVVAVALPARRDELAGATTDLIISAAISVLALVAALAVTARLRERDELAAVRRDVLVEQERRRNDEERSRIAREMHDVVAHSMSAVHMRANSAPYRLAGLNEDAREEFAAIADSARSALAELRQLLSVLRTGAHEPSLAPQPGLADLGELVEATRRAGLLVELDLAGDPDEAPDVVQLAGYRIVQEALSNAIRHAPASTVKVRIRVGAALLTVRVEDDGGPDAGRPVAAAGEQAATATGGHGHGLIGMAERVEAFGGRLWVGPEPRGGFGVEAQLPYSSGADEREAP